MWKLIKKNEHYTRQMPPADFIADTYQCSECGNKTNDRHGLPAICPWCGAKMKGVRPMSDYQETNLMPWEEFVKEKRTIPTNAEPTEIACPECGKRIYRRTGMILASYPPVHQYFCKCGWEGHA